MNQLSWCLNRHLAAHVQAAHVQAWAAALSTRGMAPHARLPPASADPRTHAHTCGRRWTCSRTPPSHLITPSRLLGPPPCSRHAGGGAAAPHSTFPPRHALAIACLTPHTQVEVQLQALAGTNQALAVLRACRQGCDQVRDAAVQYECLGFVEDVAGQLEKVVEAVVAAAEAAVSASGSSSIAVGGGDAASALATGVMEQLEQALAKVRFPALVPGRHQHPKAPSTWYNRLCACSHMAVASSTGCLIRRCPRSKRTLRSCWGSWASGRRWRSSSSSSSRWRSGPSCAARVCDVVAGGGWARVGAGAMRLGCLRRMRRGEGGGCRRLGSG